MNKKKKNKIIKAAKRNELADNIVNGAFSENALRMLKKRYLWKHEDGTQETTADMFRRVARALAGVEKKYGHTEKFIEKTAREFYGILASRQYTPAGRTLTNAGAATPLVANCIVLPIMD